MANLLKSATAVASTAGQVVLTVPAGSTVTIIGLRGSSTDNSGHTFHVKINDVFINGKDTPVPANCAIDILIGSKVVAQAGDVITAYADADTGVDVYMSYLEQSA